MTSVRRPALSLLCTFALFTLSACGGGGGGSAPPPPTPDTTLPTVSDVALPGGTTVNRTVTLSVIASDNVGVTDVRFYADGTLLGSDTTSPYSFDWDTGGETEGDHVLHAEAEDAAGNIARSGDVTVTVANVMQYSVTASGIEENPPIDTQGSAQADLTVNLATGDVTGSMTVSAITPIAAHIHDGYAGTNGGVVIPFVQDAGDAQLFTIQAAALNVSGVDRLLAGGLYVNVHTAENTSGEIRGQILGPEFVLRFADFSGEAAVPAVNSLGGGRAAMTLNTATGALVVQAQVNGLADASAAHVHEAYAGDGGPVLVPLAQDGTNPERWFVEDATLNAAGLDAFAAGRLYVNVHTPANPGGEIRAQLLPDGIAVIHAGLTGAQAVPPIESGASGIAAVTLDEAGSLVTIHVNTDGIDDASDAHLHGAYGGVNGSVQVGLTQDGTNPAHWSAEEQTLSAAQLDALLAGATYVNVHSPDHPSGEIRGQVIPDGIVFATGLFDGSEVIPPTGTTAGGAYAVTVNPAAATMVAHVNTVGVDDATMAHLHDAFAGSPGGVSVALTQDATTLSRWSAEIGIGNLTADQLAAFQAGRLYANVHTPAFPDGEIRGQVVPPPIEVLFTTLSGEERVPVVTTAATALAASTVNRETGELTLHMRTTGADDASLAHIHNAYAGQNGDVAVPLTQDAGDVSHWSVTGWTLDETGLADYLSGRFYVNLHTPANPGGEIRGQIVPQDIEVDFTGMNGDQVAPPVTTTVTGIAATTVDLRSRSLYAVINATGADDATAASINQGVKCVNGDEVLALQQTPTLLSQWSATTEPLALDTLAAYQSGGLYALLATPAQTAGEIRGQIRSTDTSICDTTAPTVSLASPGATVSGTVTLEATATDDVGVTEVRFYAGTTLLGTDTAAPYTFDWDTTAEENGSVTLTAEADDAAGNTGASAGVDVTVQNAAPVTLSQIQSSVFTPLCSSCHSGTTSQLPGGMNLTNVSASYAALVSVPSIEVPALNRVEPGNPDDSYLIRKLEGGPDIVGDQMPQFGTPLDPATINQIRDWITAGAPNN